MIAARLKANFFAAGLVLSSAILYRFSPQQYSFYPTCPIFGYLHLYCPGCGTTRALAALLHGRIGEAFHYNPLTSLVLPMAFGVCAFVYWNAMRKNEIRWPGVPAAIWPCLLLLVLGYGIYRNVVATIL